MSSILVVLLAASPAKTPDWVGWEEGQKRMTARLLPAVILHGGEAAFVKGVEETIVPSSTLRRYVPRFVWIRDDRKEDKEGASHILLRYGLRPDRGALIVVDFQGAIIKRFDEKVPPPSDVRKFLARAEKANRIRAAYYVKTKGIVEKAEKFLKAKRYREAYHLVVPLLEKEAKNLAADIESRARVVRDELLRLAEAGLQKGANLENAKKDLEARDVYEEVIRNFPFPDIQKKARARIAEIIRRLYLKL